MSLVFTVPNGWATNPLYNNILLHSPVFIKPGIIPELPFAGSQSNTGNGAGLSYQFTEDYYLITAVIKAATLSKNYLES